MKECDFCHKIKEDVQICYDLDGNPIDKFICKLCLYKIKLKEEHFDD
jgi:uncharacterized protein YlaI